MEHVMVTWTCREPSSDGYSYMQRTRHCGNEEPEEDGPEAVFRERI